MPPPPAQGTGLGIEAGEQVKDAVAVDGNVIVRKRMGGTGALLRREARVGLGR